jgi:hypothetical protein
MPSHPILLGMVHGYGGWPNNGNLIAGGPTDLGEALIPSYNWELGLTQSYKTGL